MGENVYLLLLFLNNINCICPNYCNIYIYIYIYIFD